MVPDASQFRGGSTLTLANLVASVRASKRSVRSSAQCIQ